MARSSRQQNKALKPDWITLSNELTALLREKGSLVISEVGRAFQCMYGTPLNLHGHDLLISLADGKLRGIRASKDKTTVELKKDATSSRDKTRAALAPAKPITATKPTNKALDTSGHASPSTGGVPHTLITDAAMWKVALDLLRRSKRASQGETLSLQELCTDHAISLRLHGKDLRTKDGIISLIVIAGSFPESKALIFDVVRLKKTRAGQALLRDQLCPVLGDDKIVKVVHDFTNDAIALRYHFGPTLKITKLLDIQTAFEALHGDFSVDFRSALRAFGGKDSMDIGVVRRSMSAANAASTTRPIIPLALASAAQEAISVFEAVKPVQLKLTAKNEWANVLLASQEISDFAMEALLQGQRRGACVDKGVCWGGGVGRVLTSLELKRVRQLNETPASPKGVRACQDSATTSGLPRSSVPSHVSVTGRTESSKIRDVSDPNSPSEVLKMVPPSFLEEELSERHIENLENLNELVLDKGTRPRAQLQGRGKVFLCKDESVVVRQHHIDRVVGNLNQDGKIGSDNRAGFPGQLHRVSVMRDRVGSIYGITLRIGRFFKGSAGMIDDILFHVADSPNKPTRAPSILILGEAGTGKTTVIRDICRKVSASQTLVIVDTSNEIAGGGTIPHREAIGDSRRIMVANRADQHRVMIEALQNHTPQTIVVDEISNNLEARACVDIKTRGVRLVASAHGDLQTLLKNPSLNTLLGGTTSVTLGDEMAKATQGGNKLQTQRAGAPVFDMVIELRRGKVNTWTIIKNVAHAVDALLDKKPYKVERRTRLEDTSSGAKDGASEDAAFMLQVDFEVEKSQLYY